MRYIITLFLLFSTPSVLAEMSKSDTASYINTNSKFRYDDDRKWIEAKEDGRLLLVNKQYYDDGSLMMFNPERLTQLGSRMSSFEERTKCSELTMMKAQDNGVYHFTIKNKKGHFSLEANSGKQAQRIVNAISHLCKLNGVSINAGDPFD